MPKDYGRIVKERQHLLQTIRCFFSDRGYEEVETPLCVASPGMEPNLFPFETQIISTKGTVFRAGLVTSPEYSLKKLLGYGMQKIFTITKAFRNRESFGGQHNPEFSLLEWYCQGRDYQDCMTETQELITFCQKVFSDQVQKNAKELTWQRFCLKDLFSKFIQIDLEQATLAHMQEACKHFGLQTEKTDTQSDLFFRLFLAKIEPILQKEQAVFLYDYPSYQAGLSRLTKNGYFGERFEAYMYGLELCNGFTELTDAKEQRHRFLQEANERKSMGKTVFPLDEELLRVLDNIQNPTCGNALGIDRLHMILTQRKQIEDVLLFPVSNLF